MCALGISCAAIAQTNQGSWANLRKLAPGQKIQIVEVSKKKHSGTFLSVSDSAIAINDASGQMSAERQNVRSVKLMENHHHLRNILVCTGVGAGGGAIAGTVVGEAGNKGSNGFNIISTGTIVAAGALGGGFVGAVVGALLPSHDTIFSVSPH
jgi:uncharacterized protein YcfJ